MEHVAALLIARQADARRMSAGRLDGPVESVRRPSLWHRAGQALARATHRTPATTPARPATAPRAAAGRSAATTAGTRAAAPAGGCATA